MRRPVQLRTLIPSRLHRSVALPSRPSSCPGVQATSWKVSYSEARHGLRPQTRELHVALVAPGLGDAFAALPGASQDKQKHITVPIPDPKLDALAQLERTKAIPATVEVVEVEKMLSDELARAVEDSADAELSGNFLSVLRQADAVVLAVPCREGADPVAWLEAAERALVSADLAALEKQVCKEGKTGADAELDVVKLGKALANAKDKAVKRDADEFVKDVLTPGFTSLQERRALDWMGKLRESSLRWILDLSSWHWDG